MSAAQYHALWMDEQLNYILPAIGRPVDGGIMGSLATTDAVNSTMSMSCAGRAKLRQHEKAVYRYYNDLGGGKGNCTWGVGILAHYGPCTAEELRATVTPAQVESAFVANVREAEQVVRKKVTKQKLTQAQYDALVSFTYNVGQRGAKLTFALIDSGQLQKAAQNMALMIMVKVKTKNGSSYKVVNGLVSRRNDESAPFRNP